MSSSVAPTMQRTTSKRSHGTVDSVASNADKGQASSASFRSAVQQTYRPMRPMTAYDNTGGPGQTVDSPTSQHHLTTPTAPSFGTSVSHNTRMAPSTHSGITGSTSMSPHLRPFTMVGYTETEGVTRAVEDTYFAPLDPMRPPDHWAFNSSSTTPSGSPHLSGQRRLSTDVSVLGGTSTFSGSTRHNYSAVLAQDAAYGAGLPATVPRAISGPEAGHRIEPYVNRISVALDRPHMTADPHHSSSGGGELGGTLLTATSTAASSTAPLNSHLPTSLAMMEANGSLRLSAHHRLDTATLRTGQSGRTGGSSFHHSARLASTHGSGGAETTVNSEHHHHQHHSRHPMQHAAQQQMGGGGGAAGGMTVVPVVRVERVHRADERYRFAAEPMPDALDGHLTPVEFRETIEALNQVLARGDERNGRTFLRNCLSCAILYLGFCCTRSDYQRTLDQAHTFLMEENKRLYLSRGLRWRDPRETAFLHLELVFV